jgi:hypothetical protein
MRPELNSHFKFVEACVKLEKRRLYQHQGLNEVRNGHYKVLKKLAEKQASPDRKYFLTILFDRGWASCHTDTFHLNDRFGVLHSNHDKGIGMVSVWDLVSDQSIDANKLIT